METIGFHLLVYCGIVNQERDVFLGEISFCLYTGSPRIPLTSVLAGVEYIGNFSHLER